jgi:hypothetical protein
VARYVTSPNGASAWPEGPAGLGRRRKTHEARGLARQRGISPEEINNAPRALVVVGDPAAARTSFDETTGTLVEEAEALERQRLLSTAWLARELLQNPANNHFAYLVARHADDIFVEQSAPWTLWDVGMYWPTIPSPSIDEVKRHVRQLSKGKTITLSRSGAPARRFVALDLARTWKLAEAFERENPDVMAEWVRDGLANWKRSGRRGI